MNVSTAFYDTREKVQTADMIALSADLLTAGWSNVKAYNDGYKTSRYHFHLINAHHVYVTIIITKENCLTLRGKEYKTISELFKHIDDYKV